MHGPMYIKKNAIVTICIVSETRLLIRCMAKYCKLLVQNYF